MSQYKLTCTNPDCARQLRIPAEALGHRVRCPACKQELRVPGTLEELQKLPGAKRFKLKVAKGPAFAGHEFELDPDRGFTVGRSDECNVQLPGPTISKRHFSLHWVNNQWVLEDLNTTTGTLIDGLSVTKHALRGGERIEIGAYELTFLAPTARLTPATIGAETAAVSVASSGAVDPLPLHTDDDEETRAAERELLKARGFAQFTSDHLDKVGAESQRKFSLSLASRLILVSVLLVVAVAGSLFARQLLIGSPRNAPPQRESSGRPVLPAEFVAALTAGEFDVARKQIEDARALMSEQRLLTAMQERFDADAKSFQDECLADARRAMEADEWARVAAAAAAAKKPGLPVPPTGDWAKVVRCQQQHEILTKAQDLIARKELQAALAEITRAEEIAGSARLEQRTAQLREEALAALGSGICVHVAPEGTPVEVTLNGKALAALGQELWGLPAGHAELRVSAPGFFEQIQPVSLKTAELASVRIELSPLAPPPAWVLVALHRAGATIPLWVAARHYQDRGMLPPELTATVAAACAADVERKCGGAPLRVAKITMKSGEQWTARVWSATNTMISAQIFPAGDTKALQTAEVATLEDLEPTAAAETVLTWIKARGADRMPRLQLLEEMAKLRASLLDHEEVAAQVCGAYLDTCLHDLELCCADCAGRGARTCGECNGRGKTQATVTCTLCKGTRTVACFKADCKGGTVKCRACNGSGSQSRKVQQGDRTVWEKFTCKKCDGKGTIRCDECKGAGNVPCTRCDGKGTIEGDVPCPYCSKGEVECVSCGGAGTRQAMQPEQRHAAELDAARRMSAATGAP